MRIPKLPDEIMIFSDSYCIAVVNWGKVALQKNKKKVK